VTRAKRALDVAASACGLVALAPLFAVLALIVRADGGPAFFGQERVGHHGRRFRLWKVRTMVPHAERLGPQLTVDGDPRITPVGRWLRRTKLDELPQLFNVLTGEMSLVGPRPEVPRYAAHYTPEQRRVLALVPGITDPASIAYRDEARLLAASTEPERLYLERIMPDKIRRNLEYERRATLGSDLRVVLQTVGVLARPAQAALHEADAPWRASSPTP
jgi:lipopolysaccharide/colanic/teichoic acid biosynthesis glycosyltransferase